MKLHVLGSSSSGNGYLLEASDETLVIECGCPLKSVKEALKFDISKIVGALMSHFHGDHAKYRSEYQQAGIVIYTGEVEQGLFYEPVEDGKLFSVGGFKVIPFNVVHDIPCLGFLINHPECGTILFATDTCYISKRFKGLNHVLIECNYEQKILDDNLWNGSVDSLRYERTKRSHMSLDMCIESLKSNNLSDVQNIVLIHLSPQNSNADLFRERVIESTGKTVHIAKKGLVIDFSKEPY